MKFVLEVLICENNLKINEIDIVFCFKVLLYDVKLELYFFNCLF